ncbi:deaminase [Lithospermum erythrorhizon]|uniref:Deaminase n=1 Tax=Lithospermum erythrorhizon TaxID=34254 RepID=A0AAV3PA68_LITER
MQNTFLSSNFSRKCNKSSYFTFNDYTYCLNDRFCRYPFGYFSSLCSISCCACCVNANANANSCVYEVNLRPVYLCGLRQSSLVQCINSKNLIFNGLDRVVSRIPGWDIDKGGDFRGNCVGRSRRGWGKGRYRCMVYEDDGEEVGFDDEAEVMLSLLTEEVSAECLDVRRKNGRGRKKVIVEERGNGDWNGDYQCATCGSKKKTGSGILRDRLKFEYESGVNKANDGVDKIEERTVEENKALSRRGHQTVSRKEERELLRGSLRKDERDELLRESRKKEREDSLIKIHKSSATVENREDFSRREEHRQNGSGCSSYYSLSSMGEYESDREIREKQDGFEERLSNKHKKDSGRLEEIDHHGKAVMHGGYQEEQRLVLKKGKKVEGDIWHKESEKKLTDMPTEETRIRKESDVHDDVSRKASYKKFEDQNVKASSTVKSNKGRRKERRLTRDEVVQKTETVNNYKQFKENSEGYGANLTSSSGSQTLHSQREGTFTTGSSSLKETREEYLNKARVAKREEEYRKFSNHTQSENSQKLGISKTSSSGIISETTQKDHEKDSRISLSSVHDAKEKHYHHGRFSTQIDSRITSQQLTEEIDIQRSNSSQRQSEHNTQKQEDSSSSVYGSYHESIKNIQTNEGVGKSDSKIIMEKWTNPSLGALHAGSTSGLAITEVGHDSSHEDTEQTNQGSTRDEPYGQPAGYISQEDALASAGSLQISSAYHVGEFMENVRHQMSSSEIQQEKQTHEMKMDYDPNYEQHAVTEVASGSSQSKEQDFKSSHSSRSPGSKGPSVEMWDVNEPSNQEHPGAEVLHNDSVNTGITKRTGRSLWNVMSDIVRFSWRSRSTSQSQMSKSGGKSSANQSTSSEAWFSGNEPEENIHKGTVSQESVSVKIPKEEKVQPQSQGVSSSSSSLKNQIQSVEGKSFSHAEVSAQGTSSGSNTSHQKSEGIVSGASMAAGSSQSPAIKLRRTPHVVGERSASGKVDGPSGGKIVQSELPVSTGVSDISHPAGKDEERQSRKLLRTTEVINDRFEEWEEAYRIEAEQRKMDEMFMKEALLEARKAADSWEVPVGAVLVRDGKIIARGHNLVEELRDSTAHAEMICIREASNILHTFRLSVHSNPIFVSGVS